MHSTKSKDELARILQTDMAQVDDVKLTTFINSLKNFKSTNDFIDDTDALNAIIKHFNKNEVDFIFKISEEIYYYLSHDDTTRYELIDKCNGEALFTYYKILIHLDYHIQPVFLGYDDNLRDKLYLMKYTVSNMKKCYDLT